MGKGLYDSDNSTYLIVFGFQDETISLLLFWGCLYTTKRILGILVVLFQPLLMGNCKDCPLPEIATVIIITVQNVSRVEEKQLGVTQYDVQFSCNIFR